MLPVVLPATFRRYAVRQGDFVLMNSDTRNRYQVRATIIKAMAHPTRLFIVDELAKGTRCVCELTEMIGADMSTVSKHLSVLRNAGIISMEKKGSNVYYSLTVPCVMNFFNCVESVLQHQLDQQSRCCS